MEASALAPTRVRKQTQSKSGANWTPEEDARLHKLVTDAGTSVSWSLLAGFFPNKTASQIAGRWEKVINPNLIKGSWTKEEDETIIQFVRAHGDKGWAKLAMILKGRTGKQCRERFRNHLDESVKHTPWTPEEDNRLAELHAQYGNAWTKLATFFEGRTDNCIKNRWNSTIKKRMERMEAGQPLVMKRGRKPKITVSSPEISECSSPVESVAPKAFSKVEITQIPLSRTHSVLFPSIDEFKLPVLPSQCIDLQQLLNHK